MFAPPSQSWTNLESSWTSNGQQGPGMTKKDVLDMNTLRPRWTSLRMAGCQGGPTAAFRARALVSPVRHGGPGDGEDAPRCFWPPPERQGGGVRLSLGNAACKGIIGPVGDSEFAQRQGKWREAHRETRLSVRTLNGIAEKDPPPGAADADLGSHRLENPSRNLFRSLLPTWALGGGAEHDRPGHGPRPTAA